MQRSRHAARLTLRGAKPIPFPVSRRGVSRFRFLASRSSVLSLALAMPIAAVAQSATVDPSRIESLLRPAVRIAGREDVAYRIEDRLTYYHVPGISLAIIEEGRVVFAKGYGVKEFGTSQPVDTSTLFLAGSISKPVFASGVLRLVESGKLSLDEDVNRYLTSWKIPESKFTATEKVTLRRLLSHSAGLTVWGFPGYGVGTSIPTVPQILDGTAPANTPAVRNDTFPGARWLYSGGGYTVAQLLTTDLTGEAFPALMHRLVLEPAGMIHSTYENPPPANRVAFTSAGHERIDTPVPGRFHIYPEMAAAGLWTTAPDLARWAISITRSYLGQPGGMLSQEMAREMLKPQVQVQPPYGSGSWGLGVSLAGDGDSLRFSHGGRDEGFVANLIMWPNRQSGFVVMMNGVNGNLITEIARAFAELYDLPALWPRVEKQVMQADPATLDAAVGSYRAANGRDTITIVVRREGDGLRLKPPAGSELTLFQQGTDAYFDLETGVEWSFERNENGSVARLVRRQGTRRLVADRVR
jgi:CubicO group peptidase (beta-lactamase class C family)